MFVASLHESRKPTRTFNQRRPGPTRRTGSHTRDGYWFHFGFPVHATSQFEDRSRRRVRYPQTCSQAPFATDTPVFGTPVPVPWQSKRFPLSRLQPMEGTPSFHPFPLRERVVIRVGSSWEGGDGIRKPPRFGDKSQVSAHPRHTLGAGCRWPRVPLIHFFTPHKSSIGPFKGHFCHPTKLLRSRS